MADEIVLCRRMDDHTQTHRIAVSALPYFPDWEPVPDKPAEKQKQPTVEAPAPAGSDQADQGEKAKPTGKTTASKGRD